MYMNVAITVDRTHLPIPPPVAVGIGSTIAIRDLHTDEVEVYTLVTPNKADIRRNRISSLTPVGRALYGLKVGEIAEIVAPGGNAAYRIESVLATPQDERALDNENALSIA